MTLNASTKCNIIRSIHCRGMTHESIADSENVPLASVERVKTEFLTASGLQCRTNPVSQQPYFGDTSDLLGALDFPSEMIDRILKVILDVNLLTTDFTPTLNKAFAIFREVVNDPEDWVRIALFHLALDSMLGELIVDRNWQPFDNRPASV